MSTFIRAGLLACLAALILAAQSTAVPKITVLVEWSNGDPVPTFRYKVMDSERRTVMEGKGKDGRLEIPDLDFGSHSVVIEPGSCTETAINNVRFTPTRPRVLRVIYNPCNSGAGGWRGCRVYLRVADSGGRPLAGALASTSVYISPAIAPADSFGRVLFGQPPRTAMDYTISAAGYAPRRVSLRCNDLEDIEMKIILEARNPGANPGKPQGDQGSAGPGAK